MGQRSTYPRNSEPDIDVRLARSAEERMQAYAVRVIVYMGEQRCPYAEEFDGNDEFATHVLGLVDGEPAGTLRLRWFGGFAKFEHLAVRPEFRSLHLGPKLVRFAQSLAARKGYRQLYGTAEGNRLVRYWSRYGFRVVDKPPVIFSDYRYVPMVCDLPEDPDRLSVDADDMVLIRPEGDWDRPGVLDLSAARGVAHPHPAE